MTGGTQPDGELELDPWDLSCADVPAGTTSAVASTYVNNLGDNNIPELKSFPSHPEFEVDMEDCADGVSAGDSCRIDVVFAPGEPDLIVGGIGIHHESGSLHLNVSGNAIELGEFIHTDRFEAKP